MSTTLNAPAPDLRRLYRSQAISLALQIRFSNGINAELVNVCPEGFAVLVPHELLLGSELSVDLLQDPEEKPIASRGIAVVRYAAPAGRGRWRIGLDVPADQIDLRKHLQRVTMQSQRRQLQRRAGLC